MIRKFTPACIYGCECVFQECVWLILLPAAGLSYLQQQQNLGFQESCSGRGGGIHVERGSLSLVGVSFEGNTAEAHQV